MRRLHWQVVLAPEVGQAAMQGHQGKSQTQHAFVGDAYYLQAGAAAALSPPLSAAAAVAVPLWLTWGARVQSHV